MTADGAFRKTLRKVEALFFHPGSPGEKKAAAAALARLWEAQADGCGEDAVEPLSPLHGEGRPATSPPVAPSGSFALGQRVLHSKLGSGSVVEVDGNKLHVQFDTAGWRRVADSSVEKL